MISYTISERAYVKVILHAAKYPHKQVNGVLIGKDAGSGAVQIVDSIPLLHHWTSLSPSMEIGLDLARNYAQSEDLDIVGYYQATERSNVDDNALAPVGERVAEIIKASFPHAVAIIVDGSKIVAGEPALIPYLTSGSSTLWRPAVRKEDVQPFTETSHFKLALQSSPTRALELIQGPKLYEKLGDFDDHLEDVSIDWLRNRDCNFS